MDIKKLSSQKGSITVEAPAILPLFLIFFMVILSFINLFIVQQKVETALNATAKDLSQSAYMFNLAVGEKGFEIVHTAMDINEVVKKHGGAINPNPEVDFGNPQTTEELIDKMKKDQDSPIDLVMKAQYYIVQQGRGGKDIVNVGPALASLGIRKHLQTTPNQNFSERISKINSELTSLGVSGGFSGLDFGNSKAFIGESLPKRNELTDEQKEKLHSVLENNQEDQFLAFFIMHNNNIETERWNFFCNTGTKYTPDSPHAIEHCIRDNMNNVTPSCSHSGTSYNCKLDSTNKTYSCSYTWSSPAGYDCIGSDSDFYTRAKGNPAVKEWMRAAINHFTVGKEYEKLYCAGGELQLDELRGDAAQNQFGKLLINDVFGPAEQSSSFDQTGNVQQVQLHLGSGYNSLGFANKTIGNELPCTKNDSDVKINNEIDLQVEYSVHLWGFLGASPSINLQARAKTKAFSKEVISQFVDPNAPIPSPLPTPTDSGLPLED